VEPSSHSIARDFSQSCGNRRRKDDANLSFIGWDGVNSKLWANEEAKIAVHAIFRFCRVWGMVALGVELWRRRQHSLGAKLNAKTASLAPLFVDDHFPTNLVSRLDYWLPL